MGCECCEWGQVLNFDFQNIGGRFAYGDGACPSCGGSQLSALTDPKGNSWRFAYDKYGRLTNTTNPLGQAKAYDYDKMSRVTEVKDPAGNVTAYTYDALNRLAKKDIQTPSGARSMTDYTYDAVGNLLNIANGGSAVAYTYDALNRPVATTQSFGGKAYTINYTYDAVGNRTGMATPRGKYNYTYDALNRLASIINPQNITVAFTYDAAGRRTSKKIFKTTPELLAEAVYTYDAAGELLSITNKAGGKVVAFARYEYDDAGNRVVREDQDGATRYGYDAANRLITAEPVPFDMAKAEGFIYDKNGNRRFDRAAKDYKYDAANRVLNNSVYTYTHDANGNLTSRTEIASSATVTYAYNLEQQLSEVVTPKDKLEYKYDPLGRRTARTVNGATTNYVHDGQDIIAELDEAGNPINTYTNGPGIDEPLVMSKPDGKNYYYHADALGSITAITDDSRKLTETYTYKSYGQPTIKDAKGQAIPTSIIGNTRMFAAREYEQEIGLYNNRRRYLDPSRGAFTQEDPLKHNSGGINFYLYTSDSPTNYIDPSGLWKSGGHQTLTRIAMDGHFSEEEIAVAIQSNIDVDRARNQLNDAAHNMPGYLTQANELIGLKKVIALKYELEGNHRKALQALGEGLHTIQDINHALLNGTWGEHLTGNPDDPGLHSAEWRTAEKMSVEYVNSYLNGLQLIRGRFGCSKE